LDLAFPQAAIRRPIEDSRGELWLTEVLKSKGDMGTNVVAEDKRTFLK
jgi:hypothetical protein